MRLARGVPATSRVEVRPPLLPLNAPPFHLARLPPPDTHTDAGTHTETQTNTQTHIHKHRYKKSRDTQTQTHTHTIRDTQTHAHTDMHPPLTRLSSSRIRLW